MEHGSGRQCAASHGLKLHTDIFLVEAENSDFPNDILSGTFTAALYRAALCRVR